MNSESKKKVQIQPVRFIYISKQITWCKQDVIHVLHSVKMDFKVGKVKMQQLLEHAISLILMQKNASTCNIYVLRETAGR